MGTKMRKPPRTYSIGYAAARLQLSTDEILRLMELAGISFVGFTNDIGFVDGASLEKLRDELQRSRAAGGADR